MTNAPCNDDGGTARIREDYIFSNILRVTETVHIESTSFSGMSHALRRGTAIGEPDLPRWPL